MMETIHSYFLKNLNLLVRRDFLIDILTFAQRTKATITDTGSVLVEGTGKLYVGKLLSIDGILHSVISLNDGIAVESLELPDVPRLATPQDKIVIKAGDIANYDGPDLATSVGRVLLNYTILVDPFGSTIPYVNDVWKVGTIEKLIVDKFLAHEITVEQVHHYARNLYFIGHFTELSVPTFSEKALTVSPAILARKKELLEKYAKEIAAGDVVVMSNIESELVAMDKADLAGDVSTGFYDLASKSYDNHRKAMFLTGGTVEDFGGEGGFNFVANSLEDGWDARDFPVIANEVRRGSYNRAKETAKGGEESKFLTRIFQNTRITEEDCGTKRYRSVTIDKDSANTYLYRNIVIGNGTIVTLTRDNIGDYVGRQVEMRTPQKCMTKNGYCFTCMGELFRTIDQEALTMSMLDLGSAFLTMSLKSMHVSKVSINHITSLNKFVV